MTISSRFKRHVGILIVLIFCMAGSIFALYYFVQYLEKQTTSTIDTQKRIASYEGNKKIFTDESLALTDLSKRVFAKEAYLVTPTTTPTLLSSLEEAARTQGVLFTIISAQTPGKQKDKLVIDFSVEGTEAQVKTFLTTLVGQTYQVKFIKFSLRTGPVIEEKWSAFASVQVISFNP